jgi:hypothetical protein
MEPTSRIVRNEVGTIKRVAAAWIGNHHLNQKRDAVVQSSWALHKLVASMYV